MSLRAIISISVAVPVVLCSVLPCPPDASAQDVEFNRDVREILADNCYPCHGPDATHRKAGLRLDVAENALAERRGRAAIVSGDAPASELWKRITDDDPGERMPPPESGKELDRDEIETLRRWIEEGAVYEEHWSYVPPRERPLPEVSDPEWGRGFIDRWILKRLDAEGLAPAPPADPTTLVRRLHFDLVGLPPDLETVRAFRSDGSNAAYERLVDALLASPHFGERLAMYWLDLVRFADTVGYHGDQEHPIAPYRDWVIDAFNVNMRFDRFTIEQLAGDLLPSPSRAQKIATGYNRVLQTTHEGGAQAKEYLTIYAADRVRNVSLVWLGGTLGCAQCHDHKYDPYTARDFYSMAAFFADIQEKGDFAGSPNSSPTTRPPELVILAPELEAEQAVIDAELAELRANAKRNKEAIQKLEKERNAVRKRGRRTMITVSVKPRVTRILPRGDWLDETGEIVEPAVPQFLGAVSPADGATRATRLDLARWLVSGEQPQTARVFVNRLWYLFFGKGISGRLDDTGALGESPLHPELLDALAIEFVRSGWDVKHMVRLMVTSNAYRQSSLAPRAVRERDPHNRLVARQSRWRLTAEMIRDNVLAVSGLLVDDVGGDSVKPYQPAGHYRHLNFPPRRYRHHDDERQWRRGVYVHWQRMFLHPALKAFDAPTREECTAERAISNTPQAALTLLNDPSFIEAARVLAARVLAERAGSNDAERLERMFGLVLTRAPNHGESPPLLALLRSMRRDYGADPQAAKELLAVGCAPLPDDVEPMELAAWTAVARVLLNLNETMTRN